MRQSIHALLARIRRGYVLPRLYGRVRRDVQSALTRIVLGISKPSPGHAAVVTLNPDEENASVTAVLLANGFDPLGPVSDSLRPASERSYRSGTPVVHMTFISPDPEAAREALRAAAGRLEIEVPTQVSFPALGFWRLLRAYRDASITFSTHVLLPGTDPSNRRTHVHLTHGSGPKPDTTFRGPTTLLASITPQWVPTQLREYRLPFDTPVVSAMPRLEVMRRASGDRSIPEKLGLDPTRRFVVWAPTYRAVKRAGNEIRVSGVPFSAGFESLSTSGGLSILDIAAVARQQGWQFIAKVHPHDADGFSGLNAPVFTNDDLRERGVTPYELFGAADLLITDYSSVSVERAALGLSFALWCPDYEEFARSYRGFREPLLTDLQGITFIDSRSALVVVLRSPIKKGTVPEWVCLSRRKSTGLLDGTSTSTPMENWNYSDTQTGRENVGSH